MKLEVRNFAIAVANVWAGAGLVCAVVFKLAPTAYADGANFLLHTDMYKISRAIGWAEVILAVLAWWVLAALLAGTIAAHYNRLAGAHAEVSQSRRTGTHSARPIAG